MILRSIGARHARQAFAAPVRPSCLPQPALATCDQKPPLRTESPINSPEQHRQYGSSQSLPETQRAGPSTLGKAKPDMPHQADHPPQANRRPKRRVKADMNIASEYLRLQRINSKIGQLGSTLETRFDPSSLLRDPPKPEDVTLELLMSSQTHMGHHTALWNPSNQRYIYGVRAGIHIISLEETAAALRRAAKVVEEVAYLGGLMLFVGNRKGQLEVTVRAAELAGACHLFTQWFPGAITNREQILGRGKIKIVDEKDQTLDGFESHLLERRPLLPDLVVVLNPLENFTLLKECAQENIPTIGLIDTDADPSQVTYVIPGNDDSLRAVSVIAGVLGTAGERGQERRKADAMRGICTWRNPPDVEKWMSEEKARRARVVIDMKND